MGVAMRGDDQICGSLFSYIDLEARVETEHPLRPIWQIANTALAGLSRGFEALYSGLGRPSIPPEKLLRAMLLQAFYSVRSERQLMERIKSICCSGGLSGWGLMTRCGMIRAPRRTLSGRRMARSPPNSSPQYCRSRGSNGCCRASTSRSTAP